jgi:hypothetical protein
MSEGKLTKMQIVGYKDPKFKSKVGGRTESVFTMQINPDSYSFTFKSLGDQAQILANNKELDQSTIPDKKNLQLKFHLDSTGVIPGCNDVPAAIDKFKKLCLDVNGSIHTTNYLKVIWAKGLAFPCKLESLQVDYKMFSPNGMPIRAQLSANFKEFVDPETDAAIVTTNSPDMSHMRTVEAGDTLPAMCYDIYGDPSYYLQIADINNILDFRKLVPGSKILFPRMQK